MSRGAWSPEEGLAFVPARVLAVHSFDQEKTFEEGRDTMVEGRTLRVVPGSRIPSPGCQLSLRTGSEFVFAGIPSLGDEALHNGDSDAKLGVFKTIGGDYVTVAGGDFFSSRQVAVSYEHVVVHKIDVRLRVPYAVFC